MCILLQIRLGITIDPIKLSSSVAAYAEAGVELQVIANWGQRHGRLVAQLRLELELGSCTWRSRLTSNCSSAF